MDAIREGDILMYDIGHFILYHTNIGKLYHTHLKEQRMKDVSMGLLVHTVQHDFSYTLPVKVASKVAGAVYLDIFLDGVEIDPSALDALICMELREQGMYRIKVPWQDHRLKVHFARSSMENILRQTSSNL